MKIFDLVYHIPTQRRVTVNLLGKGGAGTVGVTWMGPNERGEIVLQTANVDWKTLRHLTPEEKAAEAREAQSVGVADVGEMPEEMATVPVAEATAETNAETNAEATTPERQPEPQHKRKGR